MNFIIENWYMLIVGICVILAAIISCVKFMKKTEEERHEQIRGWLLQAVIIAEQEYGSGTGKMKLSAVYDAFCDALPWIAKVISFEKFSVYVDEALVEAKKLLSANGSMAALAETMVASDRSLSE